MSFCPFSVGYAKNQAVKQSSGKYLCYLDAVSYLIQMCFF